MPPRILVAAASKHGATSEIADRLAATLRGRGFEVVASDPSEVDDLQTYQAVVLGSAVYAGHWLKDAATLSAEVADLDTPPMVWLFSSGPVGDPPKPEEEPVDVADLLETTRARDHRVFAGKIDKSKLSFGERALVTAVRATVGDFRDWEEIGAWANQIGDALEAHQTVEG